jgi:glutathione synthase/RimK-type ligase-like ATP-grasp enzyme
MAENKLYQLEAAVQAGFVIPRTLISNIPADARQLCGESETVVKAFTQKGWSLIETRRVRPHLSDLPLLQYAPAIFQYEVPQKRDIRINIVDEHVFAVELKPELPKSSVDWRLDTTSSVSIHNLPDDVVRRLKGLMTILGLRTAAIDCAIDEGGEYIFFEVNPKNEFLHSEINGGLAISQAMAKALLFGNKTS